MWKKDEAPPTPRQVDSKPRPDPQRSAVATSQRATIGRSITIRGDVSGDEDLLIQGQVEGSVDLELHSVTVGREGRVKADISGRVVVVEGEVDGDLKAQEQVILRSSARVLGDLTSPRVVLEDGASFRGQVDMGDPSATGKSTGKPKSPAHADRATAPKPDKSPPSPSTTAPSSNDSSPASTEKPSGKGTGAPSAATP